jgi:predicted transcriptional regulator
MAGARIIPPAQQPASSDYYAYLPVGTEWNNRAARPAEFEYTQTMEVTLSPEQHAKLARLAQERGTDAGVLVREAFDRLLNYHVWFVQEVEKGLAQIESGQTLTHGEIGARLSTHEVKSRCVNVPSIERARTCVPRASSGAYAAPLKLNHR